MLRKKNSLRNDLEPQDYLLEIGLEPLPARFLSPALESLAAKMAEALKASRLSFKSLKTFGTPRRLAAFIESVAPKSEASSEKFFGPPASRLKNPDGSYSLAAEGFARKYNVTPDQLLIETTAKGEQLSIAVNRPGRLSREILAEAAVKVVSSLEFPKSMEWEESRFKFARPIRSFVSLWGTFPVSFSLVGIKTSRVLRGLNGESAKIENASDYEKILRNMAVVVSIEERRNILIKKLDWAAGEGGGDWDKDQDLISEIVAMTEHPVPVLGHFEQKFLKLPQPLISLVLKKQLKFFPLIRSGRLINAFLGVRDGISEGQNLVREGFERVLVARLNDAVFFFEKDRKRPLESYLEELKRVVYQKDLGTMAEKASRVEKLAKDLIELLGDFEVSEDSCAEISRLCYADLTTNLVKEFPELQGTLGGVYARLEGKDERIALGLEEFYFPIGPKSPIPTTVEGAIASLAGKLDSIAGCFAVGLIPTGSADPYALRRQAFGIIRIALERQLPIDLEKAVSLALKNQPVTLSEDRFVQVRDEILDFLWGRAQSFFEEKGFSVDEIRAVKAGAFGRLSRTYLRLSAVRSVRKEADFEPLAISFKRASNILKQAHYENGDGVLKAESLLEPSEIALLKILTEMEDTVKEKIEFDDFEGSLKTLVQIKPHLDLFFEKVMVMAENSDLKRARLKLLAKLVSLFNQIADLSELQGASPK